MSTAETAINSVKEAESSTADVGGNMSRALFMIQRQDSLAEAVESLEWASENIAIAKHRIDKALIAAREHAAAKGGAA